MRVMGRSLPARTVHASVCLLLALALLAVAPSSDGLTASQEASAESGPRKVVLAELFTGSECPPCAAADLAFDRLLEEYSRDEVVVLEYHVDIPTRDPMSIDGSFQRMDYYAGGRSHRSAPQAYFGGDRAQRGQGGPRSRAARYFNRARRLIEQVAEEPAGVELGGRAYLGFEGGAVEVEVSAVFDTDEELRFHLILYEDGIEYTGINKISEHRYVVREFVTGVDGRPLEPSEDGWRIVESVAREQALPDGAGLVAFVQEPDSRRVLQAHLFELGPDLPDAAALHNAAVRLARNGDLEGAIPLFREAVQVDSRSAQGHCSLGLALAGRGELGEATASWERCLQRDPARPEVHLRLSYAYEELGEVGRAVEHIRGFLDAAPDHPQAERERQRLERLRGGSVPEGTLRPDTVPEDTVRPDTVLEDTLPVDAVPSEVSARRPVSPPDAGARP